MVNLVLTGRAVSNTFDNSMEVDTGGAEKVHCLLKKIFLNNYIKSYGVPGTFIINLTASKFT